MPRGLNEEDSLQTRRRIDAVWHTLREAMDVVTLHMDKHHAFDVAVPLSLVKRFAENLRILLQESILPLAMGQRGGVLASDRLHLGGRSFSFLVILGCTGERYPMDKGYDWLIGESSRRELGVSLCSDAAGEEREQFAQILGMADRLIFTWPQFNDAGKPMERSAFLDQIADRMRADDAMPEVQRISSRASVRQVYHDPRPRSSEDDNIRMSPCDHDALQQRMTHFRYSLSAMQTYLDCPYRFMVEYLLGLREPQEILDLLAPSDQGNLYHRIVSELLSPTCELEKPLFALSEHLWLRRLDDLLDKEWLRPTTLQMSQPAWDLEKRKAKQNLTRWLSWEAKQQCLQTLACEWRFGGRSSESAYCAAAKDCLHARYDAQGALLCCKNRENHDPLTLHLDGKTLLLGGVIDRVDRIGTGVRIIDYKSGSAISGVRRRIAELEEIQLPLYALAWEQAHPDSPVEEISYIFLGAEEQMQPISLREPLQKPHGSSAELSYDWASLRTRLTERCFAVDTAVREGKFPADPRDTAICAYCICRGSCPRGIGQDEEESDESGI